MLQPTHKRICPVSGLTVRRETSWTDVYFGDNFKISADIIGEHILLTHNSGAATLEGTRKAFDFTAGVIRESFRNRPYIQLLDYTDLKKATLESRRFFIREMARRQNLQGLILFGLSPVMKISVKLGFCLHRLRFPIRIANDYTQAISMAREMLVEKGYRLRAFTADEEVSTFRLLPHRGDTLSVVRRPEWAMQTNDFQIYFEIIAGHILHSVSSGWLRDIHIPGIIALRDEVLASIAQLETPRYIVANMSGITGLERRARRRYIENLLSWHRRAPLRGFIPYGLNRIMATTVNLSKFMLPFDVYVAVSLPDALEHIQHCEADPTAHGRRPDGSRKAAQTAKDPIQRLLAYIAKIDWEKSGPIEDPIDGIDSALQPVYDAIGLIKSDVDDLIREKTRVEDALKKARAELENRVQERTAELVDTNRALNREIGERREVEQALRASEKNYRDLVDSVSSIILRWDAAGRINFLNSYGLFFFGYRAEEIIGRNVMGTIVPDVESTMQRNLKAMVRAIQNDPQKFRANENENMKKDGTLVWVYWNHRPIKDRAGRIVEILSVGTDITERRKMEAKLRLMATTDPLTGAFNRRQFFDKAKSEFQRHRRYGHTFVLMLMDLDHFKRINDNYGHPAGDAALKSFVNTANMIFRETDMFGRTGGEEFSALLPETDVDNAVKVADRLREKIDGLQVIVEGKAIHYTVSIGLTALQPKDESLREMVRRADKALYEAKRSGRNRVVAH